MKYVCGVAKRRMFPDNCAPGGAQIEAVIVTLPLMLETHVIERIWLNEYGTISVDLEPRK